MIADEEKQTERNHGGVQEGPRVLHPVERATADRQQSGDPDDHVIQRRIIGELCALDHRSSVSAYGRCATRRHVGPMDETTVLAVCRDPGGKAHESDLTLPGPEEDQFDLGWCELAPRRRSSLNDVPLLIGRRA